MKKNFLKLQFAVFILASPLYIFSNSANTKQEWFGQWNMNHDGFAGTLTISGTKVDCATTLWCDMSISYVNSKGERINGSIERIDNNLQHMVFFLNFPGNRQKFDAYLFSWDKKNLAGTTYWGNQTFGFYAQKKAKTVQPVNARLTTLATDQPATTTQEDKPISKKILQGDTIEIRYSSGNIRWQFPGGYAIRFPDGTVRRASYLQTPEYVPPSAISDQNVIKWLSSVQQALLDMIKEELLNDQVSIDNILTKERQNQFNTYQVINNRFYFLNFLNNY
ncbi:MAG TPA: hypothetical protein VIU35_16545 [Chitinophagaceae bacterium]